MQKQTPSAPYREPARETRKALKSAGRLRWKTGLLLGPLYGALGCLVLAAAVFFFGLLGASSYERDEALVLVQTSTYAQLLLALSALFSLVWFARSYWQWSHSLVGMAGPGPGHAVLGIILLLMPIASSIVRWVLAARMLRSFNGELSRRRSQFRVSETTLPLAFALPILQFLLAGLSVLLPLDEALRGVLRVAVVVFAIAAQGAYYTFAFGLEKGKRLLSSR